MRARWVGLAGRACLRWCISLACVLNNVGHGGTSYQCCPGCGQCSGRRTLFPAGVPLVLNVSDASAVVSLTPALKHPDVDGIRVEVNGQVGAVLCCAVLFCLVGCWHGNLTAGCTCSNLAWVHSLTLCSHSSPISLHLLCHMTHRCCQEAATWQPISLKTQQQPSSSAGECLAVPRQRLHSAGNTFAFVVPGSAAGHTVRSFAHFPVSMTAASYAAATAPSCPAPSSWGCSPAPRWIQR